MKRSLPKIEIFRVSCRACNELFAEMTLRKAKEKHQQHIKECQTIKALEKVERFTKKAEKILGHKLTRKEVYHLLNIKRKQK